MILSNTNRIGLTRLTVLAFSFALLVSVGVTSADDKKEKAKASPKDSYKQIEAAVIAGKITKEEAEAKLSALKKKDAANNKVIKKVDDQGTTAQLEKIWAGLKSLVAVGKMSQKEADAVMTTIKQKVADGTGSKKKASAKPTSKDSFKQIEAAVKAGKITKAEAQAKLNALKKGSAKSKTKSATKTTKASQEAIYKKLEAAVAAGKITKEQAQAKLKALQQKDSVRKSAKSSPKKGSSKSEQEKKTKPTKKSKSAEKSKSTKKTKAGEKTNQDNAETEAYLKKVWAELEAAVVAGRLTKEEAVQKMSAIKKEKLGGK